MLVKSVNKTLKIMLILVSALFFVSCKAGMIDESNYSVPKLVDDDTSPSGKKTTWQCVYFGSFPQVEILDDEIKVSVDDYALDDGIIRDKETYDAILKLVDKGDGVSEDQDIIYNGEKYRVESDLNYKDYSGSDFSKRFNKDQYYKYKSNDVKYRVFKYLPIKWRIVDVDGDTLTLISDKILMSMPYDFTYSSNWEKSFLRKYLNSYNGNGFLDTAFTEKEKNAIIKSKVRNKSNDYYDMISSGNDTEDFIYIPSNEEVFSTDLAMKYGFHEGSGVDDPAKRFRSTMYAKYMGVWWSPVDNYKGNSFWFMRTNGYSESFVTYICDFGYIYDRGTSISQSGAGILPMMKVNASKCNLLDAGVVGSDEVNKITYKLVKSEGNASSKKENTKKKYDLINFGTYPNREIVNSDISHNKDFNLLETDYIVDDDLYNKLESGIWPDEGVSSIISIDNEKYLREKRSDILDNLNGYYHYSYKDDKYHYFKIEPIVWRVLEDANGVKTLMTDKAIDCVKFSSDLDVACYDNSTIRKWLNADKNYFNLNAFTDDEKKLILDYKLDKEKMKNNYYFGVKSVSEDFDKGNISEEQINDKAYILAEEELFYGEKAKIYGFDKSDGVADINRRFTSTAYAKFKGIWFSNKKETSGNCFYMTRITGYDPTNVVYVDENGAIYNRGINIKTNDIGFLPVINIVSK